MSTPSRSPAKLLLDEHLARGEASDFEALCAAHPEHADELRRLEGLWPVFQAAAEEPASLFRGDSGEAAAAPGSWDVAEGRVLGDYRLVQRIGRGGMGEVWEAEQLSLSRRVALKLLLPERVDERGLDFFAREARAGGQLSHPGIVAVYGTGETEGLHWIAMELVQESCDLRRSLDGCREAGELGADYHRRAAAFVAELAETLQEVHDAGVIHRDLKPGNILVTPDDRPKLTDFGLAKLMDERSLSKVGELAGTYCYMSPEQVALKHVGIDHRADVFSLGVVLYEMLTLVKPFEGDTSEQVARKILWEEPPDPRTFRSRTPRDLAVICGKAMEKDPPRRYQSMAEFAADLRRHLAAEPILAKPSGPLVRMVKFARRNPTRSVAAVIAAASLAAISSLAWQLSLEKGQLAETNRQLATKTGEAESSAQLATLRAGELAQTNEELETQRRDAEDAQVEAAAERDEAAQRAEELQQVSDFQARQLSQVDPATMGLAIRAMVLDQARTAAERAGREPRVLEEERSELEELLAGADFTGIALEVLDEQVFEGALRELEGFGNQPLVQAKLLGVVAGTLKQLGLFERATEPREKELEILRRELGDEDLRTATAASNLGILLVRKGALEEAEPLLRQALEASQRRWGEEHLDTMKAKNSLIALFLAGRRLEEAESLSREVLEVAGPTLGSSSRATLFAQSSLAQCFMARGQLAEAESLFREVLRESRREFGREDRDTLAAINNLGLVLQDQFKWDEAEELYREALELSQRVMGAEHPSTLISISNLGTVLVNKSKFAEAELLFYDVLAISRRNLGSDHPITLNSINNLSSALYYQTKFSEAEPLYREALEGSRANFGDEHPDTLSAMGNLAALLYSQGKASESEALMRKTLEMKRRVQGDDHPGNLQLIENFGQILRLQGKWDEAESILRLAVEVSRRVLGERHSQTLKNQRRLEELIRSREAADDKLEALR